MANPRYYSVPSGFNLQAAVGQLTNSFQMKGYAVNVYGMGNGLCMDLRKNDGGINVLVGRVEGIRISFMQNGNLLTVSFSDEQWTDKIIGFVIGWFLCWIPWIFTGIGLYNQMQIPQQVDMELRMLIGLAPAPPPAWSYPSQAGTYSPPVTPQPGQPPVPPQGPAAQTPPQAPTSSTTAVHPQAACIACGKPIDPGSTFCIHCGAQQPPKP